MKEVKSLSFRDYDTLYGQTKLHFVGLSNGQLATVLQIANGEQKGYYYLGSSEIELEVPWRVVHYMLMELAEIGLLPGSLEQLRRSMLLKLDKFESEPVLQGWWVWLDVPERKLGKIVKPQGDSRIAFRI